MPQPLNRNVLAARIVILAALAIGARPTVALSAVPDASTETTVQAGAPAPVNVRGTVNGDRVRLDWDQPVPALAWVVEAGSAPGQSNLGTFPTALPFLAANGVPPGVYYVRVRAASLDFTSVSAPSNEIVLNVGLTCPGPPASPAALTLQSLSGFNVTLTWSPPLGAGVSSYIVEVGSASHASDVLVFDTGSASTTLGAVAPAGVYYVRVRGRNSCGLGPPSDEVIVAVGSTPSPGVIFVSQNGDDRSPGGPTQPLATIQRAIELADSRGGGIVRVAGGIYHEAIDLASNVALEGGYDPITWNRSPGLVTQVTSSGTRRSAIAVLARDVSNAALRHLTIVAARNPIESRRLSSGESIGIAADNSTLQIHDNVIIASDGQHGMDGHDGAPGAQGAGGGNGGGAGNGTGGAGGGAGQMAAGGPGADGIFALFANGRSGRSGVGAGGGSGGGGAGGTTSSRNGRDGQAGRPGDNGAPGGPPQPRSFGLNGTAGSSGLGGGGGGSGAVTSPVPLISGGGGGGGEGGHGGEGGGGGATGGDSFAIVLVDNSHADIQRNDIRTGIAGDGGMGGRGGAGGAGGAGGRGGSDGALQGGGGRGGSGGRGGRGGDGVGGSGGWSVGILYDEQSSFTGINTFSIGAGGRGGDNPASSSSTRGVDGLALTTAQVREQ